MKIWIGLYGDMSGSTYNEYVFTDKEKADEWLEQAKVINENDNDDIGHYYLREVETDRWDSKPVVPFYQAEINIDVEMPQHERAKVYYYKKFKWEVDEKEDWRLDDCYSDFKWAKDRMIEKGMNYMHVMAYAHTKEELVALVEKTFDELGMQPQIVVYSENWDA